MFGREVGSWTLWLIVGDEINPTLTPQLDILRTVPRDAGEAHRLEHRFEHALLGGRKLDKLEPVESKRIFEEVLVVCRFSHGSSLFGDVAVAGKA